MKNHSLLQSFALNKEGRVKSIEDVSRGLSCECYCPSCGEVVIARQGEVREWHFAHESGSECEGAAESALHLAAKQILAEEEGMMVPELTATREVALIDGRKASKTIVRPEIWVDFLSIELEKTISNIRPDVVVQVGDTLMFIEIAVTHLVDEHKSSIIEKMGIPTVEINLAEIHRREWDWESLKEVVINEFVFKKWVFPLGLKELEIEAREAAMNEALALPLPEEGLINKAHKPVITRFIIKDRIVRVTERVFGITIWLQYDKNVLQNTLKPIIKPLSAIWQPKFNHWLIPLEAKEHLFEELRTISTEERVVND